VQGDAGHPGYQGGGHKNNNWKKLRAEEEERHKGSLTKKIIKMSIALVSHFQILHYLKLSLNLHDCISSG
jgi:hypothetical protein